MNRFVRALFISLTAVAGAVSFAVVPATALSLQPASPVVATAKSDVCAGVGLTGGSCGDNGTSVNNVIKTVVIVLSSIVGVVAVIMIIIGGFKYITSGGDSNNIASAKHTIMYAIVGLVVVALAQVIVRFVLSKTP